MKIVCRITDFFFSPLFVLITALSATAAYAEIVNVFNAGGLQDALQNASPGDEIVLQPGYYEGNKGSSGDGVAHFYSDQNGTSSNPITLRSYSKNNKQELRGRSTGSGYVFYLRGRHWIIKDLIFHTGQKGIMFDGADHNVLDNIQVHNVGDEAVHFRDSSSDNVLKNCYIHNTGKRVKGFGEGVYVGSHNGTRSDFSHNNRIGGCQIGPEVTAEHIDIKEGTLGTIFEQNTLDGTGIAGHSFNFADSFIDIKGNEVVIRDNVMEYNNNDKVTHGIHILKNKTHENSNIYNNTVTVSAHDPFIKIGGGTTHVASNNKTTGGDLVNTYSSGEYDNSLDNNLPSLGSYTGYGSSVGGGPSPTPNPTSTPTPSPTPVPTPVPDGGSGCTVYPGDEKMEVDLTISTCVDFGANLENKTLQIWDSDENSSCNFRGTAVSIDGAGSVEITSNYIASNDISGQKIHFTSNNGCPYVKVKYF